MTIYEQYIELERRHCCNHLDYISSAGLRVLLIMHKACKGGVSLHGENEVVSEILSQTGFDSIFH